MGTAIRPRPRTCRCCRSGSKPPHHPVRAARSSRQRRRVSPPRHRAVPTTFSAVARCPRRMLRVTRRPRFVSNPAWRVCSARRRPRRCSLQAARGLRIPVRTGTGWWRIPTVSRRSRAISTPRWCGSRRRRSIFTWSCCRLPRRMTAPQGSSAPWSTRLAATGSSRPGRCRRKPNRCWTRGSSSRRSRRHHR